MATVTDKILQTFDKYKYQTATKELLTRLSGGSKHSSHISIVLEDNKSSGEDKARAIGYLTSIKNNLPYFFEGQDVSYWMEPRVPKIIKPKSQVSNLKVRASELPKDFFKREIKSIKSEQVAVTEYLTVNEAFENYGIYKNQIVISKSGVVRNVYVSEPKSIYNRDLILNNSSNNKSIAELNKPSTNKDRERKRQLISLSISTILNSKLVRTEGKGNKKNIKEFILVHDKVGTGNKTTPTVKFRLFGSLVEEELIPKNMVRVTKDSVVVKFDNLIKKTITGGKTDVWVLVQGI